MRAKIDRARLLDAAAFRDLLARCHAESEDGAHTGLVVSDDAYRTVFSGDHTTLLRGSEFTRLTVVAKEFRATAWVRVPGFDARSLRAFSAGEPDNGERARRAVARDGGVHNEVGGTMNGVQAGRSTAASRSERHRRDSRTPSVGGSRASGIPSHHVPRLCHGRDRGPVSSRRVAVVQAAPLLFDLTETLRRFETLLAEAAAGGAELVVFPEAFFGGYPKGTAFGATVGSRTEDGRALFARYRRSAVEIPGDVFDRIRAAVASNGCHVVVGVVERAGHTLYCAALLLAPDGTLLGHHRKLVPTGIERLIWGRGDGSDVAVVDTDLGRVGLAICWENYMPLYRTALYQQGVQLYCAPTVDSRDTWAATMRHIGVEGRCFVLSAAQFAVRADYPPDFPVGDEPVLIRGGSCVVDPFGGFLAGPRFDRQEVLVADLDLDVLDGAYLDLDVVGHYARPDLFGLTIPTDEPRSLG